MKYRSRKVKIRRGRNLGVYDEVKGLIWSRKVDFDRGLKFLMITRLVVDGSEEECSRGFGKGRVFVRLWE